VIDRTRHLFLAVAVAGVSLAAASSAYACSKDDTAYFDGFLDTTCLQAPLTNTTIDTFGGLRLTTNGAATTTPWDTSADFTTGVTYQSLPFGPIGQSTLAVGGNSLTLPATFVPLDPDADPVLRPTASTALDSDNVDDPTVARVGSGYVMWYSGTAEDGRGPAIFEATSSNGKTWTPAPAGAPVMTGTPGTFDARGVFAPDVLYDGTDAVTPYRMYYSGKGDVFGAIGYATSADGVTWVKHAGPVVDHGPAGSPDSFAASDPSVLKDGATYKLWYTGDDSSRERIVYATSPDGITWTKGGKVFAPEDGLPANFSDGAFAPAVFKDGSTFRMILTGLKITGGVGQTKLINASSSDGISWTSGSIALNTSGTQTKFDYSNLNAPSVLSDPTDSAAPYKLYYAGNTVDANGNSHTRIGYATSSTGTTFGKVQSGVNLDGSVLDIGTPSPAFDARQVSGLSIAATGSTPKFAGVYAGMNGTDFTPRIGYAASDDGSTWAKGAGALLTLGSSGQFDGGGQRDPGLLHDGSNYELYFTGLSSSGARTIGHASTGSDPSTGWTSKSQQTITLSGFDASGVAHPSVLHDGAAYVMWLTGYSGTTPAIGRVTSATTSFSGLAAAAITLNGTATYDAAGQKDPVVIKDGTTYRMLYTGVGSDGAERTLYATSSDGVTWDRQGLVLDPSQRPYAFDETGVEPSGMMIDGSTLHVWTTGVDRTGRTRGGHATTAFPLPGSAQVGVPNGWATYQLGDTATTVRDFRSITRTSTGTGVTLWMSFLQPYSSTGNEFWSDYFPVTVSDPVEALHFLLTVRGVRWQARLSGPAGAPTLGKVEIAHAPVTFSPTGQATTADITPPDGQAITHWGDLTASATRFAPSGSGTGGGTVTVLDAASGEQLASGALTTNGTTTLNLFSVDPAAHPKLRVRLDLTSDGLATPLVTSLKVLFNAAAQPPPPPVLTLAASAPLITFGQQATLSGNLSQAATPLGASSVSVAPTGNATTDAAGNYSLIVSPSQTTTYTASFAGATAPPAVTISVAPAVTLKAKRKGKKAVFSGTLAPSQPGHPLEIQRLVAGAWKTFATTTATAGSTISLSKAVRACGKYTFKAVAPADGGHVAGESAPVQVEPHRLTLKLSLHGRKVTFTGAVSPKHKGKTVVIQLAKGTRFVTFAKVKLSKRSTFKLVKKLKKGRYSFRASMGADRCHFGGLSRTRALRVR
jgi:predicted GH43/DUF377 family glycosyl hydrolase